MRDQFLLSIDHPVLKNHKAYGHELLPGLAYIDMLYQTFREHGHDYRALELRNLTIYQPLTVNPEHPVMIQLLCEETTDGRWQVRVEGEAQSDETGGKTVYAAAEMHRTGVVRFEQTLDLDRAKQSADTIVEMHDVYAQFRGRDLVHSGFMKAEGSIYDGDEETVMDISLGSDALSGSDRFMFHPALIDGSGVGSIISFSSFTSGEERLFLPLYFESFRAAAMLNKRCITRIKRDTVQRKQEVLSLTMEMFDGTGNKVAELKQFTGKLVRDAGSISPGRAKSADQTVFRPVPSPSDNAADEAVKTDKDQKAGMEALLRQLLGERLQKTPEQIDTGTGYYEMGLDSRGLLEIVNALETRLHVSLQPTLLFEHSTIAQLATYLAGKYGPQISQDGPGARERTEPDTDAEHAAAPAVTSGSAKESERTPRKAPPHGSSALLSEEGIAVIGMAGRYPGARNLREFWENLKEGKNCVGEVPLSRWDWKRFEGMQSPSGKNISRWGGFIEDHDRFDAHFFRISPREAEILDPQERLFLEVCWEAIEEAGYTPATLAPPRGRSRKRPVGVFAGVMHKDYTLIQAEAVNRGQAFPLTLNYASIPNRVSYFCNFHGPSMAVDTMCSSSLVAVHLALESIRRGESEVALAGGVNLSLHPHKYLSYGLMDVHAGDGCCHTFGKGGDGYVSAEGVGVVLLKPLQKAIRDKDHIYAVIKGSAINHGGTVSGITVPSPTAQADLIQDCLEKTGINPRTITCVEAHGTGTSLGDPIEIQGLVKAFSHYTGDRRFCSIGSVKSLIGHAESAAGISGLHKAVLQLHHKTLAPSLHAEELNPYIDFQHSPFYVQRATGEWKQPLIPENGREVFCPRRAGLSSFGAAGSNAHVILEEYIPARREQAQPGTIPAGPDTRFVIPLSARNKDRLLAYAGKLLEFLKTPGIGDFSGSSEKKNYFSKILNAFHRTAQKEPEIPGKGNLADIGYTLQVGREGMEERAVFLSRDVPELICQLESFTEGKEAIENCRQGKINRGKDGLDFLASDPSFHELVKRWIADGDLEKIAELWVRGHGINWELLYGECRPERISLPTYPFAGERYWVPEAARETTGKEVLGAGKERNDRPKAETIRKQEADLLYVPVWEEKSLAREERKERMGTVLIVSSGAPGGFGKTVSEHYTKSGLADRIIHVGLENRTEKISENEWRCDVNDPQAFGACLSDLQSIDCLYFISEGMPGERIADLDALRGSPHGNEIQLLRLIQYLKQKEKISDRVDCRLITRDNYRIADGTCDACGGGISGLGYALAQGEHRFSVRNIDISRNDLETAEKRNELLDLVLNEVPSERGDVIKLQAGRRYVQAFLRLDAAGAAGRSGLKRGGVYIIAGGSGTVGGIITRFLIERYQARVVWIGRKPESSDIIRGKKESFRTLGEPPLYVQADVTNAGEMKTAVQKIKTKYSGINGAIFAGLVISFDSSIAKSGEREFRDVFDVKTKGTINFYTAFQNEPLDFMCFFSSAQAFSFSGAAHLAAYASGITFSDAFARSVGRVSAFPVGTINWGFWKSSLPPAGKDLPATAHIGSLDDREGFDCFERFTALLQKEGPAQAVCLKATDHVRDSMRSRADEILAICQKTGRSLIGALWGKCNAREDEIGALLGRTNNAELEEWTTKLLFEQMRRMGLFRGPVAGRTVPTLREQSGAIGKYDRWLEEAVAVLENEGYVRRTAGGAAATEKAGAAKGDHLWEQWHSVKESFLRDPNLKSRVRLLDICLRNLPDIIQGRVAATDLLFPGSSMELVEGIYKENALSDYFNAVTARFIEEYVKQRVEEDPKARVRIIEAGAGTGGTSAALFGKLKPFAANIEYCYTDLSRAFLLFGQEQYGPANPYLTYLLWDIERPPQEQGIQTGAYDIAIAANVLHATKNIRRTIRHVKSCLKGNGILLLNEGTVKTTFLSLTFGLLDGWWLYEDEQLRIPGSPLLSPGTWQAVLEEEGFRNARLTPGPASVPGHLIAAESDGFVRMKTMSSAEQAKRGAAEQSSGREQATGAHRAIEPGARSSPSRTAGRGRSAGNGAAPDEAVRERVLNMVLDRLSKSLKTARESIDPDVSFSDYGVDSIIGVSFVKQLNEGLDLNLNSAILFDYTTVNRLAGYVVKTHGDQLRNWQVAGQDQDQEKISFTDNRVLPAGEEPADDSADGINDLERRFRAFEITPDSLVETLLQTFDNEVANG